MVVDDSPILQARGLDIRLGGRDDRVVKDLDLSLGRAEILGVAGESGAGKTQLALALTGLSPASAELGGTIGFEGESLRADDLDGLSKLRGRDISLLTQESLAALTPTRRIGDLLKESLRRPDSRRSGSDASAAAELLGEVGFGDPAPILAAYPHELSGGMRQRIGLALALAPDPKVLIADEPTTALDLRLQAELMGLLSRRRAARGTAIMLITHDLSVIAQLADRVLVLHEGAAVECGTVESVFAHPRAEYTRRLMDLNRSRRRTVAAA